jgi:hypothetical protein
MSRPYSNYGQMSEDAVWQAVERVADELKRDARQHHQHVCLFTAFLLPTHNAHMHLTNTDKPSLLATSGIIIHSPAINRA